MKLKAITFIYFIISIITWPLEATYPIYVNTEKPKERGKGSYLKFARNIPLDNVKTIFEIGSRDALDSIELSYFFKCHVFAFECNPPALEICKQNIEGNPNITLVPFGAFDQCGELPFYPVYEGNIGASSFFKFNTEEKFYSFAMNEGWNQGMITVSVIRLDEFLKNNQIENIDLLCIDAQGATFEVLKGLGDQLTHVKYIITELELSPIYAGEVLYNDVDAYLKKFGFIEKSKKLNKYDLYGDSFYENSNNKDCDLYTGSTWKLENFTKRHPEFESSKAYDEAAQLKQVVRCSQIQKL